MKFNSSQHMEQVKCPICSTIQKPHYCISKWKYGKTEVSRYECKCGRDFNFYHSLKSNWTIPKTKKGL